MTNRNVYLNDGDASFVGSFEKVCWGEQTGQRFRFGFKPPRGEKFVVMLLGSAKKEAEDFDCEGALNRLGFFRSTGPTPSQSYGLLQAAVSAKSAIESLMSHIDSYGHRPSPVHDRLAMEHGNESIRMIDAALSALEDGHDH